MLGQRDGSPQSNAARNIWVTETALTTALYTSDFGENVALFAIIVGNRVAARRHRLRRAHRLRAQNDTRDSASDRTTARHRRPRPDADHKSHH